MFNKTRSIIDRIKKNKKYSSEELDFLLSKVYNYRTCGFEEKSKVETKNGYYKYIPWGRNTFVRLIKDIQRKFKLKSFIDVGCGIGDKVILAYFFGNFEKVTGIELNETTYHVAKYFLLKGMFSFEEYEEYYNVKRGYIGSKVTVKKEILRKDAFNHNFNEHDFIYMYVPISNGKLMEKLYHKIFKEMPEEGICTDVSGFPIESLHDIADDIKKKYVSDGNYQYKYIRKVKKMEFEIYNTDSY